MPGRNSKRSMSKIARLERKVNRLDKSREEKFFTVGPTATACNEQGNIYNGLNSMSQGDTQVTRDGSSVYNKYMDLDLWVTRNSTATVPQVVRVVVFVDKQEDLNVGNFWDSLITDSTSNWMTGKQHEYRFNSKVLYDRTFNMNEESNTSHVVHKKIKLNFSTQFDASSTSILTNAIKIFAVSSSPASGAQLPTVVYRSRIHFTDS